MPMREETNAVIEQTLTLAHQGWVQGNEILRSANINIAEQTRLRYLEEGTKVGTREAAAMQRMDADKLAAQILQQRSAGVQPGTGAKVGA